MWVDEMLYLILKNGVVVFRSSNQRCRDRLYRFMYAKGDDVYLADKVVDKG